MDSAVLKRLGLHDTQAKLYEAMLLSGPATVTQLATKTNEKRTTVYMALDRLEQLGLVAQNTDKRATYHANNPLALRNLLLKQQEEIKKSNKELQAALPFMVSRYNLNYSQPGILHLEGVQAIEELYADIIRRGDEVLIFPSRKDQDDPDVALLISEQIKKQFKAGIKVRALYAVEDRVSADQRLVMERKGVFVRHIGQHEYDAQILVYGDTVAMTTFSNGVFTSLVTSPQIAQTHRAVFENMWHAATTKN